MAYAARLAARAHSVDPRAERVRTRLREAAFALAHERRVDEITVGDIVARAEVSRQVPNCSRPASRSPGRACRRSPRSPA